VRAALFLGCTVPVRAQNYELAARRIAARLGLELVDVEGFGCCGYPVGSVSSNASLWMAARNLALAEAAGLDEIVALCSACAASLAEAKLELEHEAARAAAQAALDRIGLIYRGTARVRHFGRALFEDVGAERLAAAVTRPLGDLALGVHYGCHYLKPSRAHRGPDEPEAPRSLEALVAATGARVVPHPYALTCCGGGVLAVREEAALEMARRKLDAVADSQADALVSVCPFCSVMYEGNQKAVEKRSGRAYNLPVLYLPQVLGLALGLDPADLGFKQNRVKPKALLERLGLG
jgi:heterodisulfide reductase subunit B